MYIWSSKQFKAPNPAYTGYFEYCLCNVKYAFWTRYAILKLSFDILSSLASIWSRIKWWVEIVIWAHGLQAFPIANIEYTNERNNIGRYNLVHKQATNLKQDFDQQRHLEITFCCVTRRENGTLTARELCGTHVCNTRVSWRHGRDT